MGCFLGAKLHHFPFVAKEKTLNRVGSFPIRFGDLSLMV